MTVSQMSKWLVVDLFMIILGAFEKSMKEYYIDGFWPSFQMCSGNLAQLKTRPKPTCHYQSATTDWHKTGWLLDFDLEQTRSKYRPRPCSGVLADNGNRMDYMYLRRHDNLSYL